MTRIIQLALVGLLCLIFVCPAKCQSPSDSLAQLPSPQKNIFERMMDKGFLVIPVAFYSPETRIGVGIGGYYYFRLDKEDTVTRPSSINIAAIYTQNQQAVFKLPVQLAFKQNKYLLNTDLDISRYPYRFYGIGNQISLDSSELYTPDIFRIKASLLKRVNKHIFIGPRFRYERQFMQKVEEDGRLANDTGILGRNGGTVVGAGIEALFDYRNNIFTPTKGAYFHLQTYRIGQILGGDYRGVNFSLDARKYLSLSKKVTLAMQAYWEGWSGEAPFFMLSRMGGYYRMRGYFEGAYRDKHYMQAQAEVRFPLFWKFGGVAFASIGQVAEEAKINSAHIRKAGGLGLRFLFNDKENINLRFDYAIGKNSSGFYMTVAEAF